MKFISALITKTVGTTAALLLQHINYWITSQSTDVVFRTNDQLVSDLDGMFTASQIQYAKKKLVDLGLIEVSFNKKQKWVRTTHYSLTDKGRELLTKDSEVKVVVDSGIAKQKESQSKLDDSPKDDANTKDEDSNQNSGIDSNTDDKQNESNNDVPTSDSTKKPYGSKPKSSKPCTKKPVVKEVNCALASTKEMKDSFKEGFTNSKAVACPTNLADLIRSKRKQPVDNVVADKAKAVELVKPSIETQNEVSDGLDAIDMAMLQCLNKEQNSNIGVDFKISSCYTKPVSREDDIKFKQDQYDSQYFNYHNDNNSFAY